MINVAVEGESDTEAARAVVGAAGWQVTRVVVAGGRTKLDPKIAKYNRAARRMPWVVFRDSDGRCPLELRRELEASIAEPSPYFRLRIAHSMTEAWLLADKEGFADFFRIRVGGITADPERLEHAKREVLRLCASSKVRAIREAMVRPNGDTGPLYVAKINEFALTGWNVAAAAESSESLRRAIQCIRELPGTAVSH